MTMVANRLRRAGFGRGARALTAAVAAAVSLSACSLFSDAPKPAPLENLPSKVTVNTAWSVADGRVDFPMQAATGLGLVATASSEGVVTVRPLDRAAPVWTGRTGAKLSAGVGFDGLRAAVVTQANELVVLVGGREVWRKRLTSGVTTPPLVAGERVFVLGLDRAVDAFDALDGRYLWRLQRSADPLSLQLPAPLLTYGDSLLVGQGARLVAVDPSRGTVRWEVALATPRGSNEVERLADLVGPAARLGDTVCARAFQSSVGCADLDRKVLRWTRNTGGTSAVAFAGDTVVGADASSRLTAWKADSGELLWSHERLLNRRLGSFVTWGSWVAAGDFEGHVHVFDPKTGQTVMRLPTDGSAITAAPRVDGKTMLAVTTKGGVFAWQAP